MTVINELLKEYVRMRENGLDAKATLHALRPYIEPLPDNRKGELAQYLRQFEKGELKVNDDGISSNSTEASNTSVTQTDPRQPSITPIKPLKSLKSIVPQTTSPDENLMPQGLKPGATWVACPNCKTKNKANEVFCYACGHLMDSGQGYHSTRSFADADMQSMSPEHFGHDSILILNLRDSDLFFRLRPQKNDHEIVIGRSSANIAMKPDVDLAPENAEEYGVSRLHLAIQYMMENKTLIVFDLGSANGSYINGQKLHPSEKRILRNGDELRLGRLVIRASYEHPGHEV